MLDPDIVVILSKKESLLNKLRCYKTSLMESVDSFEPVSCLEAWMNDIENSSNTFLNFFFSYQINSNYSVIANKSILDSNQEPETSTERPLPGSSPILMQPVLNWSTHLKTFAQLIQLFPFCTNILQNISLDFTPFAIKNLMIERCYSKV